VAEVRIEHRVAAVAVTNHDGKTSCSDAFIAGDPSLCKCNGDSYPWRNKVRIAQAIANAEERAELRERALIAAYASGHNYGFSLRTFIKNITRGYHEVWSAEQARAKGGAL
jgi:hypothetical protein